MINNFLKAYKSQSKERIVTKDNNKPVQSISIKKKAGTDACVNTFDYRQQPNIPIAKIRPNSSKIV